MLRFPRRRCWRTSLGLMVSTALCVTLPTARARAGCDNIPSETALFRAAQGAITAPFAVPGETLQLSVRPQVCDATSVGFGTPPACVADTAIRVTLIYEPGGGAPVNAVVLARDCGSASDPSSLQSRVAQWAQQLSPGGTAICRVDPSLDVAPKNLGTVQECRLGFSFPTATGPLLQPPDTLAGPAHIVVEPIGNPLPTALVGKRCADMAAALGSIACIDEIYQHDGSCLTAAASVDPQFPSFTALPVPNDFASMIGSAASRPTLRCALPSGGSSAFCPF